MSASLQLDVFTTPMRPVVRPPGPPAPPGGWTWPPNTAVLISGERDAILVDTLATIEDATSLANSVESKGRIPSTIYITHAHGDHFLGAPVLLERFPRARLVATPVVAESIREQIAGPTIEGYWKPMFMGRVAGGQVAPAPLADGALELEGHAIVVAQGGQSDIAHSTFLHIPELSAVVSGDIAYNDVHVNVAATDHAGRMEWIDMLGELARLEPEIVVAGHRRPDADNTAAVLEETSAYIADFDRVLAEGGDPPRVIDKMLALYPKRLNITTLYHCAHTLAGA